MQKNPVFIFILIAYTSIMALVGCANDKADTSGTVPDDIAITIQDDDTDAHPQQKVKNTISLIQTTTPDSIVAFARTLIDVPYLYASTDPAKGFDCSGFITYVFNHFNIVVPRSSVDFTDYGAAITEEQAKPGDLILFTGTDSTIRIVGHMGIVESVKNDTLFFIHSTSGKSKGVVITPFEKYYRSRFVKIIRVFANEFFD